MSQIRPNRDQEVFVGRETEIAQIQKAAERLLVGKGSLILIKGEVGAGKSALLSHSYNQIKPFCQKTKRERNLSIKFAADNCSSGGEAFAPFDRIRQELERQEGFFGRLPLKLKLSSGEISFDVGLLTLTLHLKFQDVINASSLKYVEFFRSRAAQTPLVIFLDNLHRADKMSIDLLSQMSNDLESLRILILGTYCLTETESMPALSSPLSPLQDLILELSRNRSVELIDLKYLDRSKVIEYVTEGYPGLEGDESFIDWFYRYTAGQPLSMVTLLDSLKNGKHIQQIPGRGRWRIRPEFDKQKAPDSSKAMIMRRLMSLEEGLAKTIRYASAEGEEFHSQVLAKLLSIDHFDVLRQLTILEQRYQLVEEKRAEESVTHNQGNFEKNFKFRHEYYRQVIYDNLLPPEKHELHRQIAEVYEYLLSVNQIYIPDGELAVHYERAEVYDKAVEFRLKAGQKAWSICDLDEAATHTEQGLSNFELLERKRTMARGIHLSDRESAIIGIRLLTLDSNIRIHTTKDLERAESQLAEKAITLAIDSNDLDGLVGVLLTLEVVYKRKGQHIPLMGERYERLLNGYNHAWEMAKETGSAQNLARCTGIFLSLRLAQDHKSVMNSMHEVLEAAWRQGDIDGQVLACFHIAQAYKILKQDCTSEEYYEKTLKLIDQGKNSQEPINQDKDLHWLKKTICLEDLAYFRQKKGEWEEAIGYCQKVVDLARAREYKFSEAGLLNKISWLCYRSGDIPNARDTLQKALDISRNVKSSHLLAEVLANGIECALRSFEIEGAEKLLDEFISVTQDPKISWMRQKIWRSKGLLNLLKKGDFEQTQNYLQMAIKEARNSQYDEAGKQGDEMAAQQYTVDLAIAEYQLGSKYNAYCLARGVEEFYQQREKDITLAETYLLLAWLESEAGHDEACKRYRQLAKSILEHKKEDRLLELDNWISRR